MQDSTGSGLDLVKMCGCSLRLRSVDAQVGGVGKDNRDAGVVFSTGLAAGKCITHGKEDDGCVSVPNKSELQDARVG